MHNFIIAAIFGFIIAVLAYLIGFLPFVLIALGVAIGSLAMYIAIVIIIYKSFPF